MTLEKCLKQIEELTSALWDHGTAVTIYSTPDGTEWFARVGDREGRGPTVLDAAIALRAPMLETARSRIRMLSDISEP